MHSLAISALLASWAVVSIEGSSPYWMDGIQHNGIASFNSNSTYQVYRNVRDFGALGDGVADDTDAINLAISSGGRCGGESSCTGSTTTPAVVYFPSGTYLISSSIIDYYYTQLIGDPRQMPTIKASSSFVANIMGMLDGDTYVSGKLKFASTNVFFRQLRNICFDTTAVPGAVTAVHWPSAQATSIQNCVFVLSPDPNRHHIGIFMEEGSGGFLNDLVFYGGEYGCQLGNQQYTMRNLTFFKAETAILQIWNWAWTYKSIFVYDCQVGLNMSGPVIGSVTLIDSGFYNTPTAIISGRAPATQANPGAGSLVMENVLFQHVTTAILGPHGALVKGNETGSIIKNGYAYGNIYAPNGPNVYHSFEDASFLNLEEMKLSNRYFERSKPQYNDIPAANFLSARVFGAKGDGVSDDTAALNAFFAHASKEFTHAVAFVDAGFYLVTDTVRIPPNVRIVGEALAAVILGSGRKFENINAPHPVVQVGQPHETGYIEWSDMIISTQGAAAGSILIEYNLETPSGPCLAKHPPSGMWDVHVRVGGFAGSQLQVAQCVKEPQLLNPVNQGCVASYLSMHITKYASHLYLENAWFWVADHDIEDVQSTQISVFGGRGLLIESAKGRIWLVGTCVEHHVKYQYQLSNTRNIWMGLIQTETPYFQPNPPAPLPFTTVDIARNDPDFGQDCSSNNNSSYESRVPGVPPCAMAWGLRVLNSTSVNIYGAGLYSFFNNYDTSCSDPGSRTPCQKRIVFTEMPMGSLSSTTTANGSIISGQTEVPQMNNGNNANWSIAPQYHNRGTVSEGATQPTNRVAGIEIYNLNTIGALNMISRQGADTALYDHNVAGYTSCVALFKFWENQGSLGVAFEFSARPYGSDAGDIANESTRTRPAQPSSSLPSNASSATLGYICFGDCRQLCDVAAASMPRPPTSSLASEMEARVAYSRRPVEGALDILSVVEGIPQPFGGGEPAGTGTSTVVVMPTLTSEYPLPPPSQTDCNFDYVWP